MFNIFFVSIDVFADGYRVVYDYTFDDDKLILNGVATNDNGYLVVAVDNFTSISDIHEISNFMIVKYSNNGVEEWKKTFDFGSISNESLLNIVSVSQFSNNNYILYSFNKIIVIDELGNTIIEKSADELGLNPIYKGYVIGDRFYGVFADIQEEKYYLASLDSELNILDRLDMSKDIRNGFGKFFVDKDNNLVIISKNDSSSIRQLQVYDKDFNLVNTKLINNTDLNDNGYVYEQFVDGSYLTMIDIDTYSDESQHFRTHIDYDYYIFDSSLSNKIAKRQFVSGTPNEIDNSIYLYKYFLSVYKNILYNFNVYDNNLSMIDVDYNDDRTAIVYNYLKFDSQFNELAKINLYNIPIDDGIGLSHYSSQPDIFKEYIFNLVIHLKDGSDVALVNFGNDGYRGRHIKISNRYYATNISEDTSVSFDAVSYLPGDTVKMQLRQKDGYYIDKVIVRDATGKIIPVDLKNQTFVMPDSDVTVEVQYKKIEQVKTGILASIILSLMALGIIRFSSIKYFKKRTVN